VLDSKPVNTIITAFSLPFPCDCSTLNHRASKWDQILWRGELLMTLKAMSTRAERWLMRKETSTHIVSNSPPLHPAGCRGS
jgi:hypothetical protein